MKAAILFKQNQPLTVDNIDLPLQLDVGQVHVKLQYSGICGSQIGEISGIKGHDPFLPHLLGHEGSGKVLRTGPGVKSVNVGDTVVLHWMKGSGIQSEPPKYKCNGQTIKAGWVTTFNSEAIVSENRCTPIPNDINMEYAALFGCAITTGFGVVENNAKLRVGESIVVFGAGGIGLNIIQASKLRSASPIIAIDIFDNRLDLAKQLGATHIINSRRDNASESIKAILRGNHLNVFIDNTGQPEIIELGYELIENEGRLVLVGVPRKGSNINIFSLPLHFGKTIIGSHGGNTQPSHDIPRYINLMRQGLWTPEALVTSRFKLDNINEAINSMQKGLTAGRVMIDFAE